MKTSIELALMIILLGLATCFFFVLSLYFVEEKEYKAATAVLMVACFLEALIILLIRIFNKKKDGKL